MRTLLVVVALIAITAAWVGHNVHALRERRHLLNSTPFQNLQVHPADQRRTLWQAWLLGDCRIVAVELPPQASDQQIANMQAGFPEAKVYRSGEFPFTPDN